MDVLTHLFLPLVVLYVLRRDAFDTPLALSVAVFGVLPDFDKYLGVPGVLHSALTLGLISSCLLVAERWWRGRVVLTPVVVTFLLSHLVLDLIDGGPILLFAPLSDWGIGLTFPVTVAFGTGLLGVAFEGPLVAIRTATPRGGFNEYGLISGAGVANMLVFVCIYLGDYWQRRSSLETGEAT